MKTIKHIIIILSVAFFLVPLDGCKKDFNKINDNPNSPKDVPTSYILTGAQKGLSDFTCDYWWNGYVGGSLSQYWAQNSYTEESRYLFRTGVTNSYWSYFYAGGPTDASSEVIDMGGLEELQTIIDKCIAEPGKYSAYGDPKDQIAVATALKVWLVQNMTDTWGDIPYSEALKGVANPQPKYDRQEDIYNALIAELDAAYTNIAGGQIQGDMIYGGDMGKWKKFMNSLKLRLAIRIADRNPAKAGTMISEATSGDGVFTSNADNALFTYISSSPNQNPMYHEFNDLNRKDFSSSSTLMDKLQSLNDPRIGTYYAQAVNPGGTFIGRPYGQDDVTAANTPISDVSQPSDLVKSPTFPAIFMDYAQVEFMLAEAAERGLGGASDPATHYQNAITASMNFWSDLDVASGGAGISAGDIATYLAQPSVAYATATGDWKHKIGAQKWIALYMQGVQGWTEYRRLDFGILQAPVGGYLVGSDIPKRMLYPVEEQTLNTKSYNDAVTNMGGDDQATKVWWDMY